MVLAQILLIVALVLSVIAAFWPLTSPFRPNLGWLALAFFFLSLIVGRRVGVH